MSNYLVLDIATMPLPNAADFLPDEIKAPSNWKDPGKIAAYQAEKRAELLSRAALDWDLGRIAVIGLTGIEPRGQRDLSLWECPTEGNEHQKLEIFAGHLGKGIQFITFNGFRFDLPFINARARYLGVDLKLNCDPYRSQHLDLWDILTQHGKLPGKSLEFYSRRYGWTDLVKPLSGAEEAAAAVEGRFDEVAASVAVDLQRTARLARVMGIGGTHVDDQIL